MLRPLVTIAYFLLCLCPFFTTTISPVSPPLSVKVITLSFSRFISESLRFLIAVKNAII